MSAIKKFRCHNGEIVWVEDFDYNSADIIVYYKGEGYRKSKDIIGKTLFPIEHKRKYHNYKISNTVKIGDIVKIENCLNGEVLDVKICGVRAINRYKRMGGSYYGNSVETIFVLDDNDATSSGNVINISVASPMGKSLLNKTKGDIVFVPLRDNKFEKYKIIGLSR